MKKSDILIAAKNFLWDGVCELYESEDEPSDYEFCICHAIERIRNARPADLVLRKQVEQLLYRIESLIFPHSLLPHKLVADGKLQIDYSYEDGQKARHDWLDEQIEYFKSIGD